MLLRSLIAALVFSLTVATAAVAAPQGKRIALLSTSNTQPYMGAWTKTFLASAKQLGFSVTNLTSPFDAALQSQQVDDAIAQKFDAILLVIINQQAIKPALIRAKAAGIPVILVVNPGDPANDGLYTSFIGVDQTELGRLAGENMIKGIAAAGRKAAQIAAVTGTSSQLNSSLRLAGFKEAIAKDPNIKLVAVEDGRWQTAPSEEITGDLLVRFSGRGGLDGIFAMADNQATGAIQAIKSAGVPLGVKNRGIVVVASNCMKDGMVHIKDGSQYATNTQIPVEEAKIAAAKVADFFSGKTLQKQELVPSHSITAANVDEFAEACSY